MISTGVEMNEPLELVPVVAEPDAPLPPSC